MYASRILIGYSSEGSSEPMAYYFVDSDDHRTHPPLLLTLTVEGERFVGVQDAVLELDFLRKHGLRANIVKSLKELLAK